MGAAIRLQDVGKHYSRTGADKPRTLKETALRGFRTGRRERFWALQGVALEIERGRTVGIIGANGAGKSTLLRLIAGVERPDEGSVEVEGRVGALLELGASFQQELTGIENIMLSSVVAGLTRKEARARLDEIVEFAQLEAFIESPLRTYSTGMVMRLAFSIASHVEPDVLVVDEALSVGDLSFQQRCIERLYEFRASGVTIVIVSHDPGRIRELCDEVVWLRGGRVAAAGPPMEVTARYVQSQSEAARQLTPPGVSDAYTPRGMKLQAHNNRFGSMEATIGAVHILDGWKMPCTQIETGATIGLEIEVDIPARATPAIATATIRRSDDLICMDAYTDIPVPPEDGHISLEIERLDLAAGEYVFDVGLYGADWVRTYDYHFGAYPFSVVGRKGGAGMMAPPIVWRVGAGVRAR